MTVVYKLLVKPEPGEQRFNIHGDAVFRSVGVQKQGIALWYTHENSPNNKITTIVVSMTGQQLGPGKHLFLGTVQYEDEAIGQYVLHVFERVE